VQDTCKRTHGEEECTHYIITLELREVVALLSSESLSLSCSGVDISSRISVAFDAARWNDSEMIVGWIPAGNMNS